MGAFFIRRPVLASVCSIVLMLLGTIALVRMPLELFPHVAPPEVNVTIDYTGANAETVAKAVIVPLERTINGVPGMKYMNSITSNDGTGVVQIIFETGTDADIAAINVQGRVNKVMDELPEEVLKTGIEIAKEEHSMLMFLDITGSRPEHDEKFLFNFADINILKELKRIKGVGRAKLLGARDYAMRVWLLPDQLIAYEVTAQDVVVALRQWNLESAAGKIGENSGQGSSPLEYVVKYTGKLTEESEYENIPIRTTQGGEILRLKDVARIAFDTNYFDVEAKLNGRPSAAMILKQLPGSNANAVIARVKARLAELKQDSFLPGMDYHLSFDVSRFLDASVSEVVRTLLEAFLLVTLVVFIFLQSWRATLIPALAVPVSLVGTFFFIQLFGFSLNLITLFALVLAIGIVVDNAIVVVEAVHAKMEATGLPAHAATEEAMKEIGGAIIAITLVMTAVFVPVAFIPGPAGIFYREFSLTMAVAIVLSGVVALTLTPALCAVLMRPHDATHVSEKRVARMLRGFNVWYESLDRRYTSLLQRIAGRRVVTAVALAGFAAGSGLLGGILPSGFIPIEDQGIFYASVSTPAGATLERTKQAVEAIDKAARELPEVDSVSTLAGANILTDGTGATYGTVLVNLKPWEERSASVTTVIQALSSKLADIKDADVELFPPPAVPGYGEAAGFNLHVLDKSGGGDIGRMDEVVKRFVEDLKAQPKLASAFTFFDANFPQYLTRIDVDKAALKGVSAENALGALQTLVGSEYATNFIRYGQMYRVMVQAPPEARATPEDLLKVQVRNNRGAMVPLAAFMTLEKTHGVDKTTRYNMYPSAEVTGSGKPGVSSGAAIDVITQTAKEKLPRGFGIAWGGVTLDEVEAGNGGIFVFLICLIFVYLVLAGQYESFLLPLVVILSLPPGVFGAFLLLQMLGLENNIYTHISLIMLIGLLGKNAILIVEYAEIEAKQGATAVAAAIKAASLRLRPIVMTSLAFFVGLVPLVFATGAGAVGNRTIGSAAAGGMLMGTFFGVVLVPGLYVIFKRETRVDTKPVVDERATS